MSAVTAQSRWVRPYALAGWGVLLGGLALLFKVQHVQRIHELGVPADDSQSTVGILVDALGGWAFLVAGVLAHRRRPENQVGRLMVLVGLAFFAEDVQLSPDGWVHSVGLLFVRAGDAFLVHLVLAFPEGRLVTRAERLLAGLTYGAVFLLTPAAALFTDTRRRHLPAPNLLLLADDERAVSVLGGVCDVLGAVVTVGVAVVLVHRWVHAGPPRRRVLAPVFLAGLLGTAGTLAAGLADAGSPAGELLRWPPRVAFCLLPLAFLLGLWRVRLGRTAVGTLLAQLRQPMSMAQLQEALGRALGDPSLRIGHWRPHLRAFVDPDGRRLPAPAGDGTTLVEREGRPVAVVVHDPAVREDVHVFDAALAAAELTLENQRLAADLSAQLAEVGELAGRLVTAGDTERRRLERDLHDGAQQRLVTAAWGLRTAAERLRHGSDDDLSALLATTAAGVDAAIIDLRELARGIRPAILDDAGLVAAVQALAERTPEPEVRVRASVVPRLPSAYETTAYFVAAEALTNAVKHAHAGRVAITIDYQEHGLTLTVADDGVGGADPRSGTGLVGLRDRVTALGGQLLVHSRPGRGTSVSVTMTCPP